MSPGSTASQTVGATIASLAEAETLPGILDLVGEIPPTEHAFVRRVPGKNLWIWYRVTETHVVLVTLTRHPPA